MRRTGTLGVGRVHRGVPAVYLANFGLTTSAWPVHVLVSTSGLDSVMY